MYLKKLELNGFKSFADKTDLHFEPGVTAVVGPNGCGKTNVADSIRWVMGEQSAKGLRAGEMTDVIFNGTDSRKAASMAEVTLTLSNEDKALPLEFNEISITRRVYRSGESEYLINKAVARLKDVRELFMGTGLGVGAYSVMAQGQMDQIVTAKPVERRGIFEEAAGITKYKARKTEALRKLDATDQNLVRIADIIAEIKRQISTLERQAKQAEKYRQHKEELAKLQILIHLDRSAKVQDQLKVLHKSMEGVKGRLRQAQEETRRLEQEERAHRERLAALDDELAGVREQAYKSQSEMEVTQGRVEGAKRHRDLVAEQKERNDRQVQEAEERIIRLKAWVEERLELLRTKESQRTEKAALKDRLQGEFDALERELSAKDQDLEDKNTTAMDLMERAAQMKAELESLRSQDEANSRRLADFGAQIARLQEATGEAERKASALREEKASLEGKEALAGEEIVRLQGELTKGEARIEELNAGIKALDNECSEVRSRYAVLEELQNKLTGYDAGVKEILKLRQTEPLMWREVLGVVADLLVVERSHEAAVETLLGSLLQSLVVKDRATARKVVDHLKVQGQGKVSLFVLEDLQTAPSSAGVEAPAGEGVVGPLLSFLKFEPALEPVMRALFAQDHLVGDRDSAERMSRQFPQARFITSDGDRMGPWGFLKAGSPSSGVSLLGRHREMTELADRLKGLETRLQEMEAGLGEAKKGLRETEGLLLSEGSSRQALKIRLAEVEKESSQAGETLERLRAEKAAEETERSGFEEQVKADRARIEELAALLSKSEQAHLLTKEGIAEARRHLEELRSRREEVSRNLLQAGMELSALDDLAARSKEEADRYRTEEEQLARSVELKQEENRQLVLQEQQLTLDLDDLEKRVGGLTQAKTEADGLVQDAQKRRETAAGEAEERSEKVRKARASFEGIQRELHGFEVEEAQLHVEARTIQEKLQVEYKVDPQDPPVTLEEGFDGAEAERECVELRAKIERLGLVNMVAVEEYDELSQRFKFLEEQREDLLKAKEDLQRTIHKINLTSRELFTSTFAVVQENFKDIFQRLFEGGRAELILIDEGDVLESGIEIVARPPGKRLQSVSLLSGGEKALTAIALLFALFQVKPSPFCLLDEIDAPLDDVNVGRFTHLLKEFAKRTQFIMITHNKVSMETADVMYGVTMQESGVSRIVSTRFREGAAEGTPVS